ncbi:MAG: hypothetical protein CEE38_09235 [Planctomycetes bacterium B3_Pla]|nr:MAG: hypothetical protein CEE38_09235 [Planctomycetes bacterium B3_Pla]
MSKNLIYLTPIVLVLSWGLLTESMESIASAKLVAHWKLDEGAGTIARDSSGNGNDGAFQGDPKWVAGTIGNALEFDGIDGYIDCGNDRSISDFSETYSIEAWAYFAVATDYPGLFQRGSQTTSSQIEIYLQPDANLTTVHNRDSIYYAYWSPFPLNQWTHIAVVWDKQEWKVYYDGVEQLQTGGGGTAANPDTGKTCYIGLGYTDHPMNGIIDDVRLYNQALTKEEILFAMEGGGSGYPFAFGPTLPDGELYADTWANVGWRAGDFAVSHDVYFGDSFDDVNEGAGDTFRGNQTSTFYVAGFPGFAYPDGLVPGTTYYWRIDEVNDAEPNSPWKGPVWSFSIPPKTGYNPSPADESKFIEAEGLTLGWTPGFGAKLHTVYFGESFDEIDAAAGGLPQALTTFAPPGPLEPEKTYYWRVDEFDVLATHKGDVWSFQVAREGGGAKGEYFKGMNFENLVLARTDPQIDFNWGNDGPDTTVGTDNFSCRWTGQVEAVFTETYTFYTNSDDGVRLWVDGKRLVNNWTNHGDTEDRGTIDLVAGQTYSVVMEMYENSGGAVAQLRWESESTPKQLIPAAALSFLVNAHSPSPANGTVGVKLVSNLTWKPGDSAGSHEVYLGTDAGAVAAATKASPEYKGGKALGEESLDPGALAFDTSYFWRVDEVNNANPNSPWVGNVWTLNTGDFLVVDDFEPYNDIDPPAPASNRIFDKWIDGFGTTTNGALVGNDLPPYAEQTIVNSGSQSMIYRFDNAGKTSEATLTLVWPRNWTEEGVTKLVLWARGNSSNAAERMYVALNGTAVVYHADDAATQNGRWTEWVIDLATFGVDLTNVNSIAIGFGTRNSPAVDGGAGTMYFDDIKLVQ